MGSNGELGPGALHRHYPAVDDDLSLQVPYREVALPTAALRRDLAGEPRQGSSDVEALPATRLPATSLHRVAEQAGGGSPMTGRRPAQGRDRLYTVLLAQPAASAIASYDGEALAGRGVVEAPRAAR
jgi:hypothetical protein